MWNIQANIYLDEEAKQKDPVIGDRLESAMNKYVCMYVYPLQYIFILSHYAAMYLALQSM